MLGGGDVKWKLPHTEEEEDLMKKVNLRSVDVLGKEGSPNLNLFGEFLLR